MAAQVLMISVRFHDGRYHGQGDWPPSPARLFQALVAGASRGEKIDPEDEVALRWLEALPAPRIVAPRTTKGQRFSTFVPNNDLDAKGGDPAAVASIRVAKPVAPLLFAASVPVLYLWLFDDRSSHAAGIARIALRLHRLGQGLDMAWATAETLEADEAEAAISAHPGALHLPGGAGETPCPTPGTLDSLKMRHAASLSRLSEVRDGRKTLTVFAQPPKARFRAVGYDRPPLVALYELRTPDGRFATPSVTAAARLVVLARDQAAERLASAIPAQNGLVQRFLLGRGAESADRDRRVRLMPLPSIGHRHVTPGLRRLRVEIPHDCPLDPRDVLWAFGGVCAVDGDGEVLWELSETRDVAMADRYLAPSHLWRSVTPLALGGRRRRGRQAQERAVLSAVAQALRHAGVRAVTEAIRVQREPFQTRGARADAFERPERFAASDLWHAEIRFAESLSGPLLLGDGRFAGLGVMAPFGATETAFALHLVTPPEADVGSEALAEAFRRAVMGAWRLANGPELPWFLSGHEKDGAPLRRGARVHAAFHHDAERSRFVLIPPAGLRADDRAALRTTLEKMREIRAGAAGVLSVRIAGMEIDDPLLAPSTVWESVNEWRPMRHRKTGAAASDVEADLQAEHRLRGLPEPRRIEILGSSEQPGGGFRARLSYATAVSGPLMLGRKAMKGGGLFQGVEAG